MKVKTSELIGSALDWAVAKCEGRENVISQSKGGALSFDAGLHPYMADLDKPGRYQIYGPSTHWAQGGPIIERGRISVEYTGNKGRAWFAKPPGNPTRVRRQMMDGPTPLIAACRCFVASRLGDEADVPDALVTARSIV